MKSYMLSNKGDNMFDGIINGIAAGLGAGVGVLFSQLVVRPFFAKYINPKYLHLKDQYRRVKYSNDYFRTLTLKELEWVDKSAKKMVAEVFKGKKLGIVSGALYLILGLLALVLSFIMFAFATTVIIRAFQIPETWDNIPWYRIDAGSSMIPALFAAIFFTGWLCCNIFLQTKKPAQHYEKFFGASSKNTTSYWKSIILDLIRQRAIASGDKPDLVLIGKAPFKRFSNIYGGWTLVLSGLVLILIGFGY